MRFEQKFVTAFSELTDIDLSRYLARFLFFVTNDYTKLVDYYSGITEEIDSKIIRNLESLIVECEEIKTSFGSNKNSFNKFGYWDLYDFIEETYARLLTSRNISKILRSAKFDSVYDSKVSFDYTLRQSETLENVSDKILSSLNPQNDWTQIALRNNLKETDYTPDGGNLLRLTQQTPNNLFLASVLDNLFGERLYGIDIDRVITFIDEDLKILSFRDTVVQAIEILVELKKGDIPEFPGIGIDPGIIGGNIGGVLSSSLVRNLEEVFRTDDTLVNFKVTDIRYEETALKVFYQVDTFYNLTYNSSILI